MPLAGGGEAAPKPGFFIDGADRFGIVVDSETSDGVQREIIERASVEAAQHLSRKFLN